MKKLILLSIAFFIALSSFAQKTTTVKGYTKSNGTYVTPYTRTSPNSTNHDNWSTKGNTNPITYSTGYKAPDYSNQATNHGSGKNIQTGPRGGQYYENSKGNKTYVPKQTTTSTYSTFGSPKQSSSIFGW